MIGFRIQGCDCLALLPLLPPGPRSEKIVTNVAFGVWPHVTNRFPHVLGDMWWLQCSSVGPYESWPPQGADTKHHDGLPTTSWVECMHGPWRAHKCVDTLGHRVYKSLRPKVSEVAAPAKEQVDCLGEFGMLIEHCPNPASGE